MKTIAVFSDIHGNLAAFDAVIADAKKMGATDYWFLGDLFGPGPDVQSLWNRLGALHPSVKLRGNWEDFLLGSFSGDLKNQNLQQIEHYIKQHLANQSEIKAKLERWPIHQEILVGKIKIGLSHHLPNTNTGDTLSVRAESNQLANLFNGRRRDCDIAIYAHIHHPLMRYVDLNSLSGVSQNYDYSQSDERLVLNSGSVGLPFDQLTHSYKEKRAEYILLKVGSDGDVSPIFRRISYNLEMTFSRAKKNRLPFLKQYMARFFVPAAR